jgi:hypothetical protein
MRILVNLKPSILILLSAVLLPLPLSAEVVWQFEPHVPIAVNETPETVSTGALGPPTQFVLDDGTSEGTFGFGGANAVQFLWFNQFDLPGSLVDLNEIQVLFPAGPNMAVGTAVDLVVFHDSDGDPTTGATRLATLPVTIQNVDGATFSTYSVNPPLHLPESGELLIGVIPRFIVSGVTTQTSPAAIDTTVSQGRSWIAVWTGDPPMPPDLPPDLLIDTIDVFAAGNWMIRATGGDTPPVAIPTASPAGLVVLALLLLGTSITLLRRRHSVP